MALHTLSGIIKPWRVQPTEGVILMTCGKCDGQGFYIDRRCGQGVCAHPKANISPMDCPQRPCVCSSGSSYRKELMARIDRQNAMFDYSSETEDQRRDATRGEGYGLMAETEIEAEATLVV